MLSFTLKREPIPRDSGLPGLLHFRIGPALDSTPPSASNLSDQYFLTRSAVWRSGNFVCCTATELFDFPLAVNPTAMIERSSQSSRIDFGAVAVRTLTLTPSNQRPPPPASDHPSDNVSTCPLNVRDLLASYVPSRRRPPARIPLIRA